MQKFAQIGETSFLYKKSTVLGFTLRNVLHDGPEKIIVKTIRFLWPLC